MIADEGPLGELVAVLHAENVTAAELHALDKLAGTMQPGPLLDAVEHIAASVRDGVDLAVFSREPVTEPAPVGWESWDGYGSRRDLLAATIYNARAQSPREMTPERWAYIKKTFGGSARQCLERADEEIAEM